MNSASKMNPSNDLKSAVEEMRARIKTTPPGICIICFQRRDLYERYIAVVGADADDGVMPQFRIRVCIKCGAFIDSISLAKIRVVSEPSDEPKGGEHEGSE
jgi:hypothetical protein